MPTLFGCLSTTEPSWRVFYVYFAFCFLLFAFCFLFFWLLFALQPICENAAICVELPQCGSKGPMLVNVT